MKRRRIKMSASMSIVLSVAIMADLLPWPGLGAGLIQTVTQSLLQDDPALEEVVTSPGSRDRLEVSTQNSFSASPRNDG